MSTSSILTTMQLDRSLFIDDPEGVLAEVLLAACSGSGGLHLGLDCPSEMWTCKRKASLLDVQKNFKLLFDTLICLHRGVPGWLGNLRMWPREARSLCSPLVVLQ